MIALGRSKHSLVEVDRERVTVVGPQKPVVLFAPSILTRLTSTEASAVFGSDLTPLSQCRRLVRNLVVPESREEVLPAVRGEDGDQDGAKPALQESGAIAWCANMDSLSSGQAWLILRVGC